MKKIKVKTKSFIKTSKILQNFRDKYSKLKIASRPDP